LVTLPCAVTHVLFSKRQFPISALIKDHLINRLRISELAFIRSKTVVVFRGADTLGELQLAVPTARCRNSFKEFSCPLCSPTPKSLLIPVLCSVTRKHPISNYSPCALIFWPNRADSSTSSARANDARASITVHRGSSAPSMTARKCCISAA